MADHRRTGGAVLPRTASLFDVFVMRHVGIAKASGLIELLVRIDFHRFHADTALHIAEHLAARGHDHRCTADAALLVHADRCADDIGIGVIRREFRHHLRDIVRVGTLLGASDDNVRLGARELCIALIEIEIVAGQKRITDAVDLDDRCVLIFKRVIGIEMIMGGFARCQMLLVIVSDLRPRAVKGICRIAQTRFGFVNGVDKQHGITALCRFGAFFDQTAVICRIALQHFRFILCKARHVRGLRQDDQIHRIVAGIECGKNPCTDVGGFRMIHFVFWLNDTDFHL